jgi:hypothetical protein
MVLCVLVFRNTEYKLPTGSSMDRIAISQRSLVIHGHSLDQVFREDSPHTEIPTTGVPCLGDGRWCSLLFHSSSFVDFRFSIHSINNE